MITLLVLSFSLCEGLSTAPSLCVWQIIAATNLQIVRNEKESNEWIEVKSTYKILPLGSTFSWT